jgi:peroxiredoxin
MKKLLPLLLLPFLAAPAKADTAPMTGQPAPAFTGTDIDGKSVSLSDFKGKIVVLEWTNKDCPFVHKEYDSGTMQALQKQATSEGVEWISIVSSAPGKEGNVDNAGAKKVAADWKANFSDEILDPTGAIGHLYAAKATPHMFVIDQNGILQYEGAIDDQPSADAASIAKAHNYVRAALDAVEAGKPVAEPATVAYGCAVKY